MSDLWTEVKTRFQGLLGSWAAMSALGSFVLYVLGYLALRFHLTTLGIGTDLSVIDERYLFTGAKFFIYFLLSIPILLLISLVAAALFFGIRKIFRLLTGNKPATSRKFLNELSPRKLAIIALVLSVILIQFLMRQCFLFGNLLLTSTLPSSNFGLHRLFFDETGGRRMLFFSLLVAGTLLTALLLCSSIHLGRCAASSKKAPKLFLGLIGLLLVIQFLLLPVNYGVFILEKEIPKVTTLGDDTPLSAGQEAWLVWEGNEGRTYLVQTTSTREGQPTEERKLVTVPRKDFKKIEIVRYDNIIKHIFDP